MGLFRQEYWSWLPFPSPGDQTHISRVSYALQMDSLPTETSGKTLLLLLLSHFSHGVTLTIWYS